MIRELHRFLDKSLAKGTTPNNGATVVILDGASKDLRCRSRDLVDKNNEWYVLVRAATISPLVLPGITASLRIDNELSLGQELIGNLHSRLKIASGIITQVDDEV